jgi:branched-subunit amino acid aminotransferase/4-amino-4-deoxychorismate lyase
MGTGARNVAGGDGRRANAFLTGTAAEVTAVSEIGPCKFTPGGACRALIADVTAAEQPRKLADQPR